MEGLFPECVRVACSGLTGRIEDLVPAEAKLIAGAVRKRQLEFATGRALARIVLEEIGHARAVLVRDGDRVPTWPAGVYGSISHTAGCCVAAVAQAADVAGLGVDVEPDAPVIEGLERRVCTPTELAWIDRREAGARAEWARLFFSAKEAVYKSFFPTLREFWGFHDVELTGFEDAREGGFRATLPASAGRSEIAGAYRRRGGFLVTAVAVPRRAEGQTARPGR